MVRRITSEWVGIKATPTPTPEPEPELPPGLVTLIQRLGVLESEFVDLNRQIREYIKNND